MKNGITMPTPENKKDITIETKEQQELPEELALHTKNRQIELQAHRLATEIPAKRVREGYIEHKEYFFSRLKSSILDIINNSNIPLKNVQLNDIQIANTPPKFKGDITIRIPQLGVILKECPKKAKQILEYLAQELQQDDQNSIFGYETFGPNLNLVLDYSIYAQNSLETVGKLRERYGETNTHQGENILVDFSSPNVAKTMHVGHLRSTLIGKSLTEIYKRVGYAVFRVNHLGDWGTQFGKIAVAYETWKDEYGTMESQEDPVQFMAQIYKRFSDEVKKDPELQERARASFALLEQGDKKIHQIWEQCLELSITEFEKMYELMNIKFDTYMGESFYEDKLSSTVEQLISKGIAHVDQQGVVVLDIDSDKEAKDKRFPTTLLVKSNGGTTYLTRDLAAFVVRKKIFNPSKQIYVIGSEQNNHMQQLFLSMQEIGENRDGKEAHHVSLGTITEKGGKKISSRKGAGGLKEVIERVVEYSAQRIENFGRGYTEQEKKEISQKVALGALFYGDLMSSTHKGYELDMEKIMSMKGKSGPFLQYATVRGESILRKAGEMRPMEQINWLAARNLEPTEQELLKLINRYPEILEKAAENHSPHHLAVYLDQLAKAFNRFHHDVHVLNSKGDLLEIRKHLVNACVQTLNNGLNTLNIPIPKKM